MVSVKNVDAVAKGPRNLSVHGSIPHHERNIRPSCSPATVHPEVSKPVLSLSKGVNMTPVESMNAHGENSKAANLSFYAS
jgi:hypothetical protein